ncbi:hypothetical protein [Sphingomonas bacterium]|nr:hypothetical protein [Sphingomonas bacterium]
MSEPLNPADKPDDTMGEEPEEESGAGYGNHAPDPEPTGDTENEL